MPQQNLPGSVVTAKVRWDGEPDGVGTQLFFFAPSVVAHAVPCIIEEVTYPDGAKKEEPVMKLRILVPKAIPAKTQFKLQVSPAHALAEGIIEESV